MTAKYKMQGSVSGTLHSWLANFPDFAAASFPGPGSVDDVALYSSPPPSLHGVVDAIIRAPVVSPTAAFAGTIHHAQSVTGLLAGTVSSPTASFAATTTFTPASLSPAFWLDGTRQAWSDVGATTPATAPLGRVRRIDQQSPLTGSWLAADDSVRPFRDATSFCFETVPNTAGLYGHALSAPSGTTLPANAHTFAITFVSRHSPLIVTSSTKGFFIGTDSLNPSSATGLIENVGFLMYYHANTLWNTGIQIPLGTRVSLIARATPTGLDVKADIGGVVSTASFVGAIASGTLNNFKAAVLAVFQEGFHGSISQLLAWSRTLSDAERDLLLPWLVAQTPAVAFPTTVNFIGMSGDSIGEGFGLGSFQAPVFRALPGIEAVGPQIKLLNLSVPSDTIVGAQAKFTSTIAPLLSGSRAKQVLICQIGTNSVAFGTKTAAQNLTDVYALCDNARALGMLVVLCDLLPRSDSGIRVTFEADRTTINTDYAINWASHADAFCSFSGVVGMGAFGDSNNATNYQDKVHPTPTGAALLVSPLQSAVVGLL